MGEHTGADPAHPARIPRCTIVVPVFNGSATLGELLSRLGTVMTQAAGDAWEVVFVDDGSQDASWEKLQSLASTFGNVTIIRLARNYGQHNALMCGFHHARGQVIVTLDDDLQNPPEEIPKLLAALEAGSDVVYGKPEAREHSVARNFGSSLVQWVFNRVFGLDTGLSAFRAIRGEVVQRILQYDRAFTFIDGLLAWQTDRFAVVPVRQSARESGRSGYTFWSLVRLALNMLTSFSLWPLQLATVLGFVFSILSFLAAVFFVTKKLLFGIPVTGYTSLIVTVTFLAGVQLLTLGFLGEYLGRLHLNSNSRPQFVVRQIGPGPEPDGGRVAP